MKVLLIANYRLSHQQSMQRFALMLEKSLFSAGHEVKVIRPRPILCKADQAEHGINKWLGYIDRFVLFAKELKKAAEWANVVHICDHSNAMYAKWINAPTLVSCHDLMAIQSAFGIVKTNKTSLTGRLFQKWIASGLKVADHIVCVSKNTQYELIKTLAIPVEKTSVAYNALNYPYSPMTKIETNSFIKSRLPDLDAPFFFHLGGNQWYKNRQGVAEIFSYLIDYPEYQNHKLILAGKPWPQNLKDKINSLGIQERVIEISDLTNEEIRAFYSTCEAMIFPSLQEGFGWPIAEAQACGAVVVTTNRAPMTEVGGNAAIYIEPEKPQQASKIIVSSLDNSTEKKSLGIENSKKFTEKEMLASYLDGYLKAEQN
jgi:glycosyltransferase involved in cell wall biosynthesis